MFGRYLVFLFAILDIYLIFQTKLFYPQNPILYPKIIAHVAEFQCYVRKQYLHPFWSPT